MRYGFWASLLVLVGVYPAWAGLHNSAEPPAPLTTNVGEFLLRLSEFRSYGPPDPLLGQGDGRLRQAYLAKVQQLRERELSGRLSAEETANLGAYLIRLRKTRPELPDYEEAVKVLENGRRQYPRDFACLANLGTVYQLTGRLDAAASCLQDAEALAPREWQIFERYHYRLVRQRLREQFAFGLAPLDPLFTGPNGAPLRYVGESGEWEIGKLAATERAKLPNGSVEEAIRIVEQLLVWFPEDGRLIWQLGELANAQGDVIAAHAAMQEAVFTFRLSNPELKDRRVKLQEPAAWRQTLAKAGPPEKQAAWVLQAMALGGPGLASPDSSSQALGLVLLRPRLPDLGTFPIGGGDEDSAPPPAVPFYEQLSWKGWAGIAAGAVLIIILILLQARELYRRRQKRAMAV